MAAENSPLIISFLDGIFSDAKVRQISGTELQMLLEDYLYSLNDREPDKPFPRSSTEYLSEWSRNDRAWLRKFYPVGTDDPHYDLTPASEKALGWIRGLFERSFIGTESRLHSSIDLLKQIVHGMEEDSETRIERLEEKKRLIDEEIEAVRNGSLSLLDPREVRERFLQFGKQAVELLGDFRAVEYNFRELDRSTREKISTWTGDKSSLLQELFGEHDSISRSDEGQSFKAFWDFLMSPSSQEELSSLLSEICSLDAVRELDEHEKYKRIHFDWMMAGEQTQRTVARLSQQLRRFLDDKAYFENRRIITLIDGIEAHAVGIRDNPPENEIMTIDKMKPEIRIPMDTPLFSPPLQVRLADKIELPDHEVIDADLLFNQRVVDPLVLKRNIHHILQRQSQASLKEVLDMYPMGNGLAELISYLSIAENSSSALISDEQKEEILWTGPEGHLRRALIPGIIFNRKKNE